MFKKFNSYYNLYNLFSFLSSFFVVIGSIVLGVHFSDTSNVVTFLISLVMCLLSVIFGIYSTKYFNKTYQFKNNSKKVR